MNQKRINKAFYSRIQGINNSNSKEIRREVNNLIFLKYAFPKLKAKVQILQAFPLKIVPRVPAII